MQPANVGFPDVELWAATYLRAALAARPESYAVAYVSNAVPSTRRDRMVIVRRDGGPRVSVTTEAARLAVRVWAPTEKAATDLARLVRALLTVAADGNPVCRVADLSGPSAVPDESGQPLRYFVLELTVRGVPLPADLEP